MLKNYKTGEKSCKIKGKNQRKMKKNDGKSAKNADKRRKID